MELLSALAEHARAQLAMAPDTRQPRARAPHTRGPLAMALLSALAQLQAQHQAHP